ncbi:MAG TPA: putative peptidoglycan glycosyltransferase FtsW [Anaerolineales bacterium]|nr:putative peptidoglycan glycosyltransferase FtsW [Anaerolineales bacterium]
MGSGTFVKQKNRSGQSLSRMFHLAGIDLVLLAAIIALSGIGLLMVYSSSTDFSLVVLKEDPNFLFFRQLTWFILGFAVAAGMVLIDYHWIQKLAIWMIAISIAGLVAVLLGNELRNGAVRTFMNGSIQPSEFAKLVTILYLSVWLSNKKDTLHDAKLGLIPLAVIVGIISGLILMQPDLSATLTIILLGAMLFFLADGDIKQIGLVILTIAIVALLMYLISSTAQARITQYIGFLKDPSQAEPQLRQSLAAIVNGKFFGVGLGESNAKLTGLQLPHSDSIFAVLVEETGLFGALILVTLYGLVLWRGLKISRNAPDMLGSLMAAGLTFWICIEATLNMGAIVGVLPLAGSALPFISYGGSSLLSNMAAIGILMSIARQQNTVNNSQERRPYRATVDLRGGDRRRRVSRTRRGSNPGR